MKDYSTLINKIEKITDVTFRKSSLKDIELLQNFNLPSEIINFYKHYEPPTCIEHNVRLWPISEIIEENTNYVPGCYTQPHGYIVFSTTIFGDTYCFDLNANKDDPPIVLISHEVISEESTKDEIASYAKPIAGNLYLFLEHYIIGDLDEGCIY